MLKNIKKKITSEDFFDKLIAQIDMMTANLKRLNNELEKLR